MLEYIREHRRVAKMQFKNDDDLVKTYVAVIDKTYERQKFETKQSTDGYFAFFYIDKDLWKKVEENVPESEYCSFLEEAIRVTIERKSHKKSDYP